MSHNNIATKIFVDNKIITISQKANSILSTMLINALKSAYKKEIAV